MTLVKYLSSVVGLRVLGAVTVLTLLGLGLDLLDSAGGVMSDPATGGLARYAALRAPAIALSIAPVALLAGVTMGFVSLGARNELTVLRAAGVRMWDVLLRLVPLGLACGLALYLVSERLAPAAERALATEFAELVDAPRLGGTDAIWARTPGALVRIGAAEERGALLRDVTIFELDAEDALAGRIEAGEARYEGGAWTLAEGARRGLDGATPTPFATRRWRTRLMPADVLRMQAAAETVAADEARAVLAGAALAVRAPSFYEVKAQRALAVFTVPFVMLLLAAPAALAHVRSGRALRFAVVGFALGVCFLAVDGIASALGERGATAPALAVWAPPAVFGTLGFWVLLMAEE